MHKLGIEPACLSLTLSPRTYLNLPELDCISVRVRVLAVYRCRTPVQVSNLSGVQDIAGGECLEDYAKGLVVLVNHLGSVFYEGDSPLL